MAVAIAFLCKNAVDFELKLLLQYFCKETQQSRPFQMHKNALINA
jgi:hypothetical protein